MDKSNFVDLEMENGTVQLTLNFYRLSQLQTKHKNEYKLYFDIQKENGPKTDLDAVKILYVAYLCANMESMPDVMSQEEFLQNMKQGRARVWRAYNDLMTDPKN